MRSFLLVSCLAAVAVANPGGYTGIGGVYKNLRLEKGVMEHAKKACKLNKFWSFVNYTAIVFLERHNSIDQISNS
jgi:hypothetical protein